MLDAGCSMLDAGNCVFARQQHATLVWEPSVAEANLPRKDVRSVRWQVQYLLHSVRINTSFGNLPVCPVRISYLYKRLYQH